MLQADPSNPPCGWGLYLEEGFKVPELIQWMASILATCVISSVLAFCTVKSKDLGPGIFGLWSGTITLIALIFTVVTKLGGK